MICQTWFPREERSPIKVGLYQAGRLKPDEFITGRYPFDRINAAMASSRGGQALRNVIVIG